MKVRKGFVSNSSSSSFVVGKTYMTEEQQKKFNSWNMSMRDRDYDEDGENDGFGEETYIFDTKYYFCGEISNHDYEKIVDFLTSIGVNREYICSVC